ncbi:MAG: hypothetical protein Rubg2KO_16230 [Rubricoccaceae bacterium]
MRYLLLKAPLFLFMAALVGLSACDSGGDPTATDDLVVVEAFLYAGEAVDDVRLTEVIPLTSEDTVAVPISDAQVALVKGGVTYPLVASDSAGYYHYPAADLAIEAGDVFRLEVVRADQTVTAETVVPPPPSAVTLSSDVLEVATIGPGDNPRGVLQNTITAFWDNPAADLHYVVIQSLVTGEPEYILPEFFQARFAGFQVITEPTDLNVFDVSTRALEVLGPHRVVVYRINAEYVALYEDREQDSRDLNEPPTNVVGGLGVFSAFNSRSATFEVVRVSE